VEIKFQLRLFNQFRLTIVNVWFVQVVARIMCIIILSIVDTTVAFIPF